MVGPAVTPNAGITSYHADGTQGPACALACPAGTVYRNYFVGGHGQGGPTGRQIDLLEDVEVSFGGGRKYWKMRNGYSLPLSSHSISALRADVDAGKIDVKSAQDCLRVGVHWDTEVTAGVGDGRPVRLAQVYCSAVPVGYDNTASRSDWEPLARLCLNACYEATLAVATILARRQNRRIRVFLTKVGGGVFGNSEIWISDAIRRALGIFQSERLDVHLVHFRTLEPVYLHEIEPIGMELPLADCVLAQSQCQA